MEEWRFGNMEKCRSRNMEEGREKVNEQQSSKRLRLNTSPRRELRLNANEQRSNKLQISLNNYFLTHELNNHKVAAVIKLINEFPEEVVREILLRVTYKSHYKLMSVCKSWNAMVDNHTFYQDRIRFGRYEELICLIQRLDGGWAHHKLGQSEAGPFSTQYCKPSQVVTIYDPVHDKWEAAPSFPTGYRFEHTDSCCVSINHKLVFFGLYKQDTDKPTHVVLVYDFSSSIWKQGSDMPVFHSAFACAVSPHDGLIYIAGGYHRDGRKNTMFYNVEKDKWEILPKMQQNITRCQGFFNHDKFYVISHYNSDIEIFDTNKRLWTTLKNMWISGWHPDHCVAGFGGLYYFQNGVKEYDWKENVWRKIGHFPSMFEYVSFGGTAWQDKIFLIGIDSKDQERFSMFQLLKSGTMIFERWIQRPIDIYDHVLAAVNVKV
ncbi:F-box/kelch-repeat protein SKIP20 [Cryptomeria japonica]|uniref:F-box/kelch-repeat protein SKIP20 n=1 Tax=Cryptomeria japonica TaxID=3369 RepID=UPI0027DA67A6|nr:F-box/kelch-repeat protein SKIP20 [Cryptomeria japonica]XP_057838804.2 F-box/kelch-repeat protein SKIP20 [Cryptomeria japonica]XP_057838805.2 F-box/kelch-repeat protein SKIP20 [Cryptomeria japonica]XP_057838806.2 F-box/kelch-repeat protein SKIP20 [Cryptomeria japonica]XP_057838808.2 F-box/kelch-repeat protein SKIP20 [Cryptomeria japonica]XP_059075603.1 F-box/kelch-repeat protein SKIP20 [Cryptomeria japonica]XP_059075610.1 F-box/kelch-repeat protein SKIP20 [Cryptomeria japonica]XP_05907561